MFPFLKHFDVLSHLRGLRESLDIASIHPVQVTRSGMRHQGRSRKVINKAYLQAAMTATRRLSVSRLSRLLGVHRNTLRKYLRMYQIDYSFSNITDHDLDTIVKRFREVRPDSGIRYLVGFLRQKELRVQGERVVSSIKRVDPIGHVLHTQRPAIRRRQYQVPRPNAVWHIDGHHKLIRWGFVIHGGVDGYDRTVCSTIPRYPNGV